MAGRGASRRGGEGGGRADCARGETAGQGARGGFFSAEDADSLPPEESARAINARQKQGEMANSHWLDNLARSIRFCGRQLVDLIPKIYDVPRIVRMANEAATTN